MCCRFRGLLRRILSFYYSKEPKIYSEVIVYNPNNVKLDWHTIVPKDVIVVEKIQAVSIDDRKVCYRVWNEGDEMCSLSSDDQMRYLRTGGALPWLWIGGDSFFKSQDRTSVIEPYIVSGNKITKDLLNNIDSSITNWHYLDPATFKEVEFPDEGITIK